MRIEEKIMKRILAFILLAAMCLSLVACGAANADTTTAPRQNETTVANTETEATTVPSTNETTASTEESTAPTETQQTAFDTKWAGAEYDMPIPEPPFEYKIDIRNNGVKISSINGGVDGDVTHSNILAYCTALKEAGFNIDVSENVIGERYGRTCYEFSGKNENGNSVELLDDGGGVVIFAYFDITQN